MLATMPAHKSWVVARLSHSCSPSENTIDITRQFGYVTFVKLLPLPQPQLRAHERTDKSKRTESHSTKECARACVLCLKAEPKYYYCPITFVMT
jgi:hypothetical protein